MNERTELIDELGVALFELKIGLNEGIWET